MLAGAWPSSSVSSAPVDSPAPLPCPPFFLAHEHRTASLSLPSTSSCPTMAGDAPPATTHATAPPCMAAAGFPSSLAHVAGTLGFARGWGACWSPSPGRRPHRRRTLAAGDLLCFCSADGWGPADPRAHCQSLCVSARVQIRVHPAFSSAGFKRDLGNDFSDFC